MNLGDKCMEAHSIFYFMLKFSIKKYFKNNKLPPVDLTSWRGRWLLMTILTPDGILHDNYKIMTAAVAVNIITSCTHDIRLSILHVSSH